MALQEIMGSRSQQTTGTRITVTRMFECLKTEITNTGGASWIGVGITLPAKGDALPYGTWTNLVTPRLFSMRLVPHRTRRKTYVVCYYGAPVTQGTASGTRIELADSQIHEVNDEGKWTGLRRFSTPDADIITNRAAVAALSWTVNSIALTPKRTRVSVDPGCPGTSIITGTYAAEDNPFDYTVDKVRMAAKTVASWVRAKKDKDGAYIHGNSDATPTFYLRRGIIYRPTQGSDLKPKGITTIWLKTAYARPITWSTSMGLVGKTNAAACANICNAAIGELLCMGCDVPETFLVDKDSSVVPVIYTLLYKKDGWNKDDDGVELKVATYHKGLEAKYILHPTDTAATRLWMANDGTPLAGTDAGPNVTTNAKVRVYATMKKLGDDEARTIFANDGDFSALNSAIYWGG